MIIPLSCLLSLGFGATKNENCPYIEATITTKKADAGKQNGEITIAANGGNGQLHYFFFNDKGRPINSTKEKQNSIKGLGEGTYNCSVVDQNGCIKQIVIELK